MPSPQAVQLIKLDNICLAYGSQVILDHANLQINKGDRVCLVGRNGTGKSTLFRILTGEVQADDGEFWQRDTLRMACLAQEVPQDAERNVYDLVAAGLGELGDLLAQYHQLTQVHQPGPQELQRLSDLQHKIEVNDGWNLNQKVESIISKLQLPSDKKLSDCSGGVRRRVMLAQALVSEPDCLLLDEPTNHMDIEAITWLEDFLKSYTGALLFITHDRTFVRNLSTRIIELDRGVLTSFDGDYEYYIQKKEELLQIEQKENARFDKKLAEHEAWIRQGIKARRTRDQGRVRRLKEMREQHSQRLKTQGSVNFKLDTNELSGKIVADLRDVSFSYENHCLVKNFSCRILRGDRIGIIGPNGVGKSTLLKLLLGELKPDSGKIVSGTRQELAYFDQHREQLDLDKTVRDNISHGKDFVNVRGKSLHVISYLRDFLFPPDRIDSKVSILSGGERNRLLLARIFTRPSNILILDEPTNDLDVDTLELLEDLLSDYEGTLLLVSHDRTFLDNVVSSTLVFEGPGEVKQYVGGYDDWLKQRKQTESKDSIRSRENSSATSPRSDTKTGKTKNNSNSKQSKTRLGYKEQRELDSLPEKIETIEQNIQALEQTVSQAEFYQQSSDGISATLSELDMLRDNLQQAYERWEYLDNFGG